jgi:hypothetical protein
MEMWMKGKQMGVVHLDAMVLLNHPVPSKSDFCWLTAHGPLFIVRAHVLFEFFTGFWRSWSKVGYDLGAGLFVQTMVTQGVWLQYMRCSQYASSESLHHENHSNNRL